jgi:serine protease Do
MRRLSLAFSSLTLAAVLAVGGAWYVPHALRATAAAPPVNAEPPKEQPISYRAIVKKVLPAVVSIESHAKHTIKAKQPRRKPPTSEESPQTPDELRKFFDQLQPGANGDDGDDGGDGTLGFGSGFIVDPKGVVMTNFHVVDGADEVTVELNDGRKFTSRDIKSDSKTDLAIVRIHSKDPLPYLEFGDSDAMEIGDRVLAVGAPFGLTGTVTSGIISAKGRNLRMNMYEDFLQTDAAINPGNSGGPLINMEGKVIGINSAIKSRSGGFQGIGLAIASNLVKTIETSLVKNGSVHRGYLGVGIDEVDNEELANHLGVKTGHGVIVTQVFSDGPAAKAGLKEGDVITALGGKPVKDMRSLQGAVAVLSKGKPVELSVIHDGKPETLSVTIEEQPPTFGSIKAPRSRLPETIKDTTSIDSIGAEAADLTPKLAEGLGYSDTTKGVLLTGVDRDGMAASVGLARGMVVTKVEQQPVTSADTLKEKLDKAALDKGVMLQVRTPRGGVTYIMLKSDMSDK